MVAMVRRTEVIKGSSASLFAIYRDSELLCYGLMADLCKTSCAVSSVGNETEYYLI